MLCTLVSYIKIYFLFFTQGRDNFGHSIPELSPVLNGCITTTSSQQQLTTSQFDPNMTPIASGPRLGRKVTIGIDILIQVLSKYSRLLITKLLLQINAT